MQQTTEQTELIKLQEKCIFTCISVRSLAWGSWKDEAGKGSIWSGEFQ